MSILYEVAPRKTDKRLFIGGVADGQELLVKQGIDVVKINKESVLTPTIASNNKETTIPLETHVYIREEFKTEFKTFEFYRFEEIPIEDTIEMLFYKYFKGD